MGFKKIGDAEPIGKPLEVKDFKKTKEMKEETKKEVEKKEEDPK